MYRQYKFRIWLACQRTKSSCRTFRDFWSTVVGFVVTKNSDLWKTYHISLSYKCKLRLCLENWNKLWIGKKYMHKVIISNKIKCCSKIWIFVNFIILVRIKLSIIFRICLLIFLQTEHKLHRLLETKSSDGIDGIIASVTGRPILKTRKVLLIELEQKSESFNEYSIQKWL